MAYAAVFEDDIIARHGLRACGLSEESLKHPDTNADKVVAYLETKFDEDPVLIRKLTVRTWQPKKFGSELSRDGWTANKKAAVESKDLKLDPASVGGVEAALMDYFTKHGRQELAVAELNVAQQEYDVVAADYFPALDELIADRKRVRLATEELDVQVQVLATMESDANDTTRKPAPERDLDSLRNLVTSAGAISAELNASVLRATALENAVQKFDGMRSVYAPIAERYVKVMDANPDLEAFVTAAETLRQTLRSAAPLTKADTTGPCQPFADYLEALALRTRMTENEARQRLDLCDARCAEAREDVAAAQDSADLKRDRAALERLRKDAAAARERARIVQTRLIDLLKETEAGGRTGVPKRRKKPV
jgi:hypothetical protein